MNPYQDEQSHRFSRYEEDIFEVMDLDENRESPLCVPLMVEQFRSYENKNDDRDDRREQENQVDISAQQNSVKLPQQLNDTLHFSENRQIFHNFQKHLIVFIKNHIIGDIFDQNKYSISDLGLKIIRAFKLTRSNTKGTLSMIFGVGKGQEQILNLCQKFQHFSDAIKGQNYSDILSAQKIIREVVIDFVGAYSREDIRKKCAMNRFDDFYAYLMGFVDQMRQGAISKRISRTKKNRILKKMNRKQDA